jgi:hypothetical protein
VSTIKSSAENLTLNADGANNDIIFQSNGSNVATLDQAGLLTATTFAGSGASLTALPAANLTGTVADARISALTASKLTGALPAISGASLTGIATPITALNNATANELVTVGSTTTELDAEANLTFDGTDLTLGTGDIVFGTAGKGICLGVTTNTNANTLDDYEEGSWTPGFATGTPTYTTTYNRMGRYTKIGNVCHVHMEMYMGSISFADATALLTINGLPFAANSAGATFGVALASHVQTSNMYSAGVTYNTLASSMATMLDIQPRLSASATTFVLAFSPGDNSVIGEFKNAAFHNGSGLCVGLSYRTA